MDFSTLTTAQTQQLTQQTLAALTELADQTARQNELILKLVDELRDERDALAEEVARLRAAAAT